MVLEEIMGSAVCTIIRANGGEVQLNIGDYFTDHERSTLTVTGGGKIIVRVDENCTIEIPATEAAPEISEVIEVVGQTAPVVVKEVLVQDTVAATETPAIIFPAKTSE
jgi:hypothetical protein